ncbi:MAG TPA: YmfQ family protein [Candidatus Flavonifractor merdavium]|nr:YmfQ family protein [Candidatus Flavonifractor merdavium]
MDRYDFILQLPEFYRSIPFSELQRVLGETCRRAGADLEFTFQQLWPQTASGWGLELWETAYGIPIDVTKDVQFRRTRVISKLRGQGTPTVELIQAVAASFANGTVEVIEHNDEFYFVIKFVSILGVPPNINDLTAAINEIKPAHLKFIYEYTYRQWAGLKPYTWGQLINKTWKDLREGPLP